MLNSWFWFGFLNNFRYRSWENILIQSSFQPDYIWHFFFQKSKMAQSALKEVIHSVHWIEKANRRAHWLFCNTLFQRYIYRHLYYKTTFIASVSIWLSTPLYLWVFKFSDALLLLRKPFSANHLPLSSLFAQCLLPAQRRGFSVCFTGLTGLFFFPSRNQLNSSTEINKQ